MAVREEKGELTESGWYRIATGNRSVCKSCLLQVGQPWVYQNNGGKLVSVMFSNNVGVAQVLNKFGYTGAVDKVRYVFHATELSSESWMDVHFNVLTRSELCVSASSIMGWEFYRQADWKLVEVAGGYTSNEYDIT